MLAISHELHAVLKQWGKVQGLPASTLVASFLEEHRPIFKAMTEAIIAKKEGKESEAIKAMAILTGSALSNLGDAMQGKRHAK